jgi:hypothetical protein
MEMAPSAGMRDAPCASSGGHTAGRAAESHQKRAEASDDWWRRSKIDVDIVLFLF